MIDLADVLAGFGAGLIGAGSVGYFLVRRTEERLIELRKAVKLEVISRRKADARIDSLAHHVRNPDRGWEEDHMKTMVREAPTLVNLPAWRLPGGGL